MTTIQERHARAASAADLGMVPDLQSAPDVLAAAGCAAQCGSTLGALLARLRAEVDAVARQEIEQSADDATARVLVLMRLRTLRPARDALGLHAAKVAVRLRTELGADQHAAVVSQVLVHWLWPGCDACTGRGVTGGYGLPWHVCPVCRGFGRAQGPRFKLPDQRRLADELLCDMDQKVAKFAGGMAARLRMR